MGDTNTNYQTYNGNLSDYLGKNFSYGQLQNLNSSMGQSAGNQPTFISGGNIYQVKDQGNNTFGLQQVDTVANRQGEQAQQTFAAQQGSAISGLQNQQSNLAGQYGSLLSTVKGQYQPLIDQATMQQNEQNASRGLVSNVGNGGTQMLSALNPIYSAQAANAQQLGQGSINDMNTLQQAIANAQQAGAQFGAELPLQYGSLALSSQALPSSIQLALAEAANQNASANNIPVSQGGLIFNPSSGNYSSPIQSILKQLGINLTV